MAQAKSAHRDFCFVANAVQANLLSASSSNPASNNQIYIVAVGDRTTFKTFFLLLLDNLVNAGVSPDVKPKYQEFRAGDVRHSQADISKSIKLLNYKPTHNITTGIAKTMSWFAHCF